MSVELLSIVVLFGVFFLLMFLSVPVSISIGLATIATVLLSLPWVLYQAWAFVSPGLYAHERRFVGPLIILSVVFLLVGIGFAYSFVLPVAYKFFFSFAEKTGADVMQDLQRDLGLTYMFITHDLSVVKHISDNIAVLYLGQCVELASSKELLVRVDGSRKRFTMVRPRSAGTFLMSRPTMFFISRAVFRTRRISSTEKSSSARTSRPLSDNS